ncbi:hypothetical protein L2E82_27779 [Cichorium intybus]|uniref:Uncharacterized protein n=1 Tax=Cichorium intybus TaxID=13427 RepID=A0ACB9CTY8_CICIN|nr:hypothetical protein L2E82_27779 [Cichorium intybus]
MMGIRRWRLEERRWEEREKVRIQARRVHEEIERRKIALSIINGGNENCDVVIEGKMELICVVVIFGLPNEMEFLVHREDGEYAKDFDFIQFVVSQFLQERDV